MQQPILTTAHHWCTGCWWSQSAYSTSWLFWRTKSCMEACHLTSVHSSLIFHGRRSLRSAGCDRLVVPPVKLSTVRPSQLLLPKSWTVCFTASLPLTCYDLLVLSSSIICSKSPVPMLFCDCLYCDTSVVLAVVSHLSHFKKIFDWLIDWLIDSDAYLLQYGTLV